ncbi:MAG: extracellular solute-binding protein [Candidatus Hydrogenedentes bacterium]|nr:extracellular solute-binding protein [Candidatus Hydrogenedentota bacterium]
MSGVRRLFGRALAILAISNVTPYLAVAGPPYLGPGPAASTGIAGELRVDSWNIAAVGLKALLPEFSATYPNIHATIHMSGAQLQARFMLSLAAGVGAPDVTQLQFPEVARYAATGRLTDLTEVAQRYWKDFPEHVWKDCMHEGRIYAIPWDIGPCGVFYKRDIFERYGIDPGKIETWEDYLAAGQRLLQASGGKTRMFIHPTGFQDVMFEMLLRQRGGQIFDEAGRIAVNSSESLEVLQLLKRFVEAGTTANIQFWSQPFFGSFSTDTVATYPMAAWFGGFLQDYAPGTSGNWGVFPLPAFSPGGVRTSSYGGSAVVIPDQCVLKDAAWSFLEFMICRPASQLAHYQNFNLFPAMTTVYGDSFFDEPLVFYGGQAVRRFFTQNVERIPVMHHTQDWLETRLYVRQSLGKWAGRGMGDGAGFLADLEARLARRLDREIAPGSLSQAAP